jgi:hypothetical protein
VRNIIGAHGGSVRVESSTQSDQSETTGRFTIPCF